MSAQEELLNKLKSTKKRQDAKDNLDAIYKACCKLVELRHSDFSISHISRFGAGYGVPKAQSIRNNRDYVLLIKAFKDKNGDRPVMYQRKRDAWIDELSNPRHKILARKMSADLSQANTQIAEMKPIDNTIVVRESGAGSLELQSHERKALEYLISQDFLRDHNLQGGSRGDLLDHSGNEVFKVGTIDALEKVLASS